MNVVSKLVYTDKLDKIVEKYNNAYHGTIRMKPTDIKSGTFKVDYHLRIFFAKATHQIGLRKSW